MIVILCFLSACSFFSFRRQKTYRSYLRRQLSMIQLHVQSGYSVGIRSSTPFAQEVWSFCILYMAIDSLVPVEHIHTFSFSFSQFWRLIEFEFEQASRSLLTVRIYLSKFHYLVMLLNVKKSMSVISDSFIRIFISFYARNMVFVLTF